MRKLRFLKRKDTLFPYCYLALEEHFETEADFANWYEGLGTDEKKDTFLKVGSYYLALVKNGDWHVNMPDSNEVIEYFTNTFKLIAVFSLIESLSNYRHIEFYDYLKKRDTKTTFPLTADELDSKYHSYKEEYGSIRRCIAFFENLSDEKKTELVAKLESKDGNPSIVKFAQFLYTLRSEFVHRAELIHEISDVPVITVDNKSIVVCYLSMQDTMRFFEEGLLAWCNDRET